MPLYYFHFRCGSEFHPDTDGIMLENAAEALDCALELATARITNPKLMCDWGKSAYEIEAADGGETFILSMASVLARVGAADARPNHRWIG